MQWPPPSPFLTCSINHSSSRQLQEAFHKWGQGHLHGLRAIWCPNLSDYDHAPGFLDWSNSPGGLGKFNAPGILDSDKPDIPAIWSPDSDLDRSNGLLNAWLLRL
ncbi:hypothetical protein PCASD_00658 [Puccinia coronata f. sp. avenae]|uniref:Uncharacterized protein n=1 Tax=Puccinia coronata f. sp. avenae TaxID=200324 RepID=A0A2N5VKX8_9BASI|nr:hypothetical protein PCASD_00658 [Puccinia coronata f. sp. avenae]